MKHALKQTLHGKKCWWGCPPCLPPHPSTPPTHSLNWLLCCCDGSCPLDRHHLLLGDLILAGQPCQPKLGERAAMRGML